MIQDIAPHKLDNQFIPGKILSRDSLIYVYNGRKLLVSTQNDEMKLPTLDIVESILSQDEIHESARFLFRIDDKDCFIINTSSESTPEGFEYMGMRDIRKNAHSPKELIFSCFTAIQLNNWYKDNKFCGTCGSTTKHSETERAMVCPNCGRTIYPRIIPAVIVGITNGDKLLLTQYAGTGRVPYYALVAGFTEIGETLEETVQREVMEEVGLKVKNIRYYKSQPWGIADDLLAGFYCDVDGDDTINMDENELKLAKWMTRDEIVLQPDDYSLTNEMMKVFKFSK